MAVSAPAAATYRGYGARPPMDGLRLFHGVVLDLPDFAQPAYEVLHDAFAVPFAGLTTDGTVRPGLTALAPEGRSTAPVALAAQAYLAALTRPDHHAEAAQPLDSPYRRRWFNAFPDWSPPGVLLDDLDDAQRAAALRVVEESLSAEGYAEVRKVMRLNGLLGDFVGTYVDSLREHTYFFTIFGEPRPDAAWAWQLMGHHLDLNCLVLPEHVVQTPMFLGSEFNGVEGVTVFEAESAAGPALLAALDDGQRAQAVLYDAVDPAVLPPELAGPVDGRHRGGAGQDNLVIPYAGVPAAGFSAAQQDALLALVDVYLARFPEVHARQWRREIVEHLGEAHFAWIGDPGGEPPFYYRVHTPVLWIEFDHHQGIFLGNDVPEPFHVHTIVRMPNGGDYGASYVPVGTGEV
ncbi:MAG TPA: DUF3500 domain-containing protein [Baekduia sp.]|nr:DUF3500 domain-containing protein [Baekduia sp.]